MTNATADYALITGASSGLGAEFARQLAARGYNLILAARRGDRMETLKREIGETSTATQIEIIVSDLSSDDGPQALYDAIKQKNLPVDVLINNAGFGIYGRYADTDWARERELLQVDIVAVAHLTKLFATDMIARGGGHILQVSSIGAYQPTPTYAIYSAAKAFELLFGEALNFELKRKNVKVTVLSPGVTETEFLDVAGQRRTLYQKLTMMQAPRTVREGLNALFRGKPSVVAGLLNAFLAWSTGLLPRRLQAFVAYVVMRN
ncbi:MAG: SDR family oxidoreductase [Alphaproteobacteria bacterium]